MSIDKDNAQRRLDLCEGQNSNSISPLELLYDEVMKMRSNHYSFHKFHFTKITGKKWNSGNNAEREALEIITDSFRRNKLERFNTPLHCKLAVLFYHSVKLDLYGGTKAEQQYRYYETTLRFLLKGSLNYLYDNDNKVTLHKIISDGSPFHRGLDYDRIIKPLLARGAMRGYAQVSPNADIIQLKSDHKLHSKGSEKFKHCMMLQLADLLLGSVRYAETTSQTKAAAIPRIKTVVEDKKAIVSYPVKEMLSEWRRDEHSRRCNYYKSVSLSEANLRNNKWTFTPTTRLFNTTNLADYT